ncbi:MAG: quinoprotein relay system zinc metallohydrolase 2 [Methylotenera sp.]|nr:quinoprotein relay system zinc metallohydrolase 2 [Methylotenera sp.]MDO9233315.1 quinoprotein relay system zinc metallohydrolase 2 [Methylotenera sp.]MDO9388372.1 quinoprotein relay system zinc metallohydrolase 2 [Methylotenera sp.]MDP2403043.1 quinoprotein relay system zinc metallohydrolase 2 [Methylotenera sp.]MDP3096086.1 quinoprotein relay system zinc metallohydrolase 2 [Methylotenera sp.]
MRILMIIMSVLSLIGCANLQAVQSVKASSEDFKMENVGDGIYVHHGEHLDIDTGYQGDICNISFIVGSRGVAVIDTGGSLKVGRQLREAIRQITSLPVLYVVNSHVHPDHIYGNAAFLADKPEFVGHEKLANAMESRKEQYAKLNARFLHEDAVGTELIKPTLAVKDKLELDLGGRKLMLTAHPVAHTNTDVSMIDSKTGTLFTGDLLFIERTPVIESDVKGLIAEIEKLKSSDAKQVVPGHGPVTKDWIAALSDAQRYLNVLLADVRNSIKNNEGMEKSMDTAAASEKGKWKLFDVANRRNVNTIYPALEWE